MRFFGKILDSDFLYCRCILITLDVANIGIGVQMNVWGIDNVVPVFCAETRWRAKMPHFIVHHVRIKR